MMLKRLDTLTMVCWGATESIIDKLNQIIEKVNEIDERTRVRPSVDFNTIKWTCGEVEETEKPKMFLEWKGVEYQRDRRDGICTGEVQFINGNLHYDGWIWEERKC